MEQLYKEMQERLKYLEVQEHTEEVKWRIAEIKLAIVRIQQLLLVNVSGSFLSNLEYRINEILLLGLDITLLKFNQEDAVKFKSELKEITGIDVSSIKMYKGISIQKSKGQSIIVAMSKFRDSYSRNFDMYTGEELL